VSALSKTRSLGHCCVCLLLVVMAHTAWAHGGVVSEEEVCTIYIGYFKAHFKAYQPETSRYREFCEDLPDPAETVFVMEYVHGDLGAVPIDFRIVRDVTGHGRLANLADVERIANLDEVTVYHQPPTVERDVFTVNHEFDEPGWYIGIVTVPSPTADKTYVAVFPFKVGFTGFGWWPLLGGVALLAQLGYWFTNGQLSRWRERLKSTNLAGAFGLRG